uniref:Uncharacterized protein n=2 Tax=Spongospora subterranea TaxID=70186 RepID=A0A0H5RDI7_9EUKA|eukprot:CRZ12078.1 hypothetical protein [Spongospora subterranea]
MGLISGLDRFFSASVFRSLSASGILLALGVGLAFAPQALNLDLDKRVYDASVWTSIVTICSGVSILLLDTIWTHSKILYQFTTRDYLEERLLPGNPSRIG